jgi:rubrerythrin
MIMTESYRLDDLFNTLLALEETGERAYSALAASSTGESRTIFLMLAKQEHQHFAIYAALKSKAGYTVDAVDDEQAAYLDALIRTTMRSLSDTHPAGNRAEALRRGMQLEKDTLIFLHSLHQVIDPPYHAQLATIIRQEQQHLILLQNLLATADDPA